MANELMQQAFKLYQAGNRKKAVDLLTQVIQQEPNNAEAWYGLAVCVQDANTKVKCLHKVLALKPEHVKAQQALEQLEPSAKAPPELQPALPPEPLAKPQPELQTALQPEPIPDPGTGAILETAAAAAPAATRTCPHCGTTIPSAATVCPNCFQTLSGEAASNLSELDKIGIARKREEAEALKSSDTLGIIALICGITGLCLGLPAIAAVIVGNMASRKGSSLGKVAAILGYIGIALMVIGIILMIIFYMSAPNLINNLPNYLPTP